MPSAPRPVDDGEAPDWNDPEMGKTGQWSRRWRGVGNFTGSGARQHSRGAAHGRQEQEHRLKKEHGYWINIQWSLLLESFVD